MNPPEPQRPGYGYAWSRPLTPGEAAVPTAFPWPLLLAAALVASCAWLGAGCAPSRATFEERATNGTVRRMVVSSFALWPATQSIEKQKASLGKTFSFGAEGIEQDGGSTNLTESLRETRLLIQSLKTP